VKWTPALRRLNQRFSTTFGLTQEESDGVQTQYSGVLPVVSNEGGLPQRGAGVPVGDGFIAGVVSARMSIWTILLCKAFGRSSWRQDCLKHDGVYFVTRQQVVARRRRVRLESPAGHRSATLVREISGNERESLRIRSE